jgi:hypothetical protein
MLCLPLKVLIEGLAFGILSATLATGMLALRAFWKERKIKQDMPKPQIKSSTFWWSLAVVNGLVILLNIIWFIHWWTR